MSRRDVEAAAHFIPDDAVEAFAVAGTLDQCRDKLQAYEEAGLDELALLLAGDLEQQRYSLAILREMAG